MHLVFLLLLLVSFLLIKHILELLHDAQNVLVIILQGQFLILPGLLHGGHGAEPPCLLAAARSIAGALSCSNWTAGFLDTWWTGALCKMSGVFLSAEKITFNLNFRKKTCNTTPPNYFSVHILS